MMCNRRFSGLDLFLLIDILKTLFKGGDQGGKKPWAFLKNPTPPMFFNKTPGFNGFFGGFLRVFWVFYFRVT